MQTLGCVKSILIFKDAFEASQCLVKNFKFVTSATYAEGGRHHLGAVPLQLQLMHVMH